MSANKSWTKLTTMLAEVLSSLDKDSSNTVLAAWNQRKRDVSKLLGEGKEPKTKDGPKKPNSSYIIFCNEHRQKLRSQNPQLSATELTTALGALWKSLKDKSVYEEAAAKEKERYEKERGVVSSEKPTGPRRPLAAYMYFCQDQRQDVQKTHKGKDVTTELGRRWKLLTDEQKAPYEAKHREEKSRYEAGATATHCENGVCIVQKTETEGKTEGKTGKNDTKSVKESKKDSKKGPSPGYSAFTREVQDELAGEMEGRKLAAEVMRRWKALSVRERDEYELAGVELADE